MRHLISKISLISSSLCIGALDLVSCSKSTVTFDTVPQLFIYGDVASIGEEEKTLSLKYVLPNGDGFNADVLMKLQGNYSVLYPKKNWNIKLFEPGTSKKMKVKMQEDWIADHKYTLKANYVDSLSLHNIGTCSIWGDVVHSRKWVDELQPLLNGGAIDGFPFACYCNDQFWGLYTWNLKKHEDLFGMSEGEDKHQGMLLGNWQKDSEGCPHLYFYQTIDELDLNGWQLEFCSTKSTDWMVTSFNNFIQSVIDANDSTSFKTAITEHSNFWSLIDYFVFISFAACFDNIGNNIMWVTYDGVHWIPSLYDAELTFGFQDHNFPDLLAPTLDFSSISDASLLFQKLNKYCYNEIVEEYNILKQDVLSYDNICNTFDGFWQEIPNDLWRADINRWPEDFNRTITVNTLENLKWWVSERIKYFLNEEIDYGKD